MIVRRIREHLSRRDWLAVTLDLVVAILGVFIGIQVSNWNQVRGERMQSREDRRRLIADLDTNILDYRNRGEYFAAVQRHALAALAALEQPPGTDGEALLIHAYQASQISPREAKHVTYDEIVASGRLTRLGPPALRDRVGNYYIALGAGQIILDYIPPYRERLRRAMPGAIQMRVRARCREQIDYLADGTALFRLAETCHLGLDPATVAEGVRAVRAMSEVTAELNRVVGDTDGKAEALESQVRAVRGLRAMLAAADGEA